MTPALARETMVSIGPDAFLAMALGAPESRGKPSRVAPECAPGAVAEPGAGEESTATRGRGDGRSGGSADALSRRARPRVETGRPGLLEAAVNGSIRRSIA